MDDDYGGTDGGEPNYSGLDESWRDIRPDFGGDGGNGGSMESDFVKAERARGNSFIDQERAREAGRASENSAAGGVGSTRSGSRNAAREAEGGEGFQNNVAGGKGSKGGKLSGKGMLKKGGPFGLLLAVVIGGAAWVGSSQIVAPFAILNNALTIFNSTRIGMDTRSNYMEVFQLSSSRGAANDTVKIFNAGLFGDSGSGEHNFGISDTIARKYQRNGIEYVEMSNGGKMLVYQDENDGHWLAVVGVEEDKGYVPGAVELSDGSVAEISEILTMEEAQKTNDNYSISATKSTRVLKGHIAGWYDRASTIFLRKLGNFLRQRLKGVNEDKSDDEIIADAKRGNLDEGIEATTAAEADPNEKRQKEDGTWDDYGDDKMWLDYDDDKEPDFEPIDEFDPVKKEKEVKVGEKGDGNGGTIDITETQEFDGSMNEAPAGGDDAILAGTSDVGEVGSALLNRAGKILAGVGQGVDFACMVSKALAGLNVAIRAVNMAKIINYVTGFLEAISKTQAGDGGTELTYYMTKLTTQGSMVDMYGEPIASKSGTSAMQSPAINHLFGGSAPGATAEIDDIAAVEKYNNENMVKASWVGGVSFAGAGEFISQLASASSGVNVYRTCLGAGIVQAGISLVGDLVPFGKFAKQMVYGIVKATVKSIVIGAISTFVSTVIAPYLVQRLATDYISNVVGEDLAYAISSGLNMYIGGQQQSRSGAPGTNEQVMAMYEENQRIIAQDAAFDRATKSPFDITSQYTFLGSLMYSMIPIGSQLASYSAVKTISSMMGQVGSSVQALFPSVNAASRQTWYQLNLNAECPSLSQYDFVGDPYCNDYYITGMSTVQKDPVEVIEVVASGDNFDSEELSPGNPKVKRDSELGKWITSCAMREAPYGVADARTASIISTGNSTMDRVISTGISMIPILGTTITLFDELNEANDFGWTTGSKCKIKDDDPSDMTAYYSRYSEDQSWAENAGLIDKSAVTAYMEEILEEYPLDNSVEGVIARFSGWSAEQTEDVMDTIGYVLHVAEYDAAERLAFGDSSGYDGIAPMDVEKYHDGSEAVVAQHIVYADLRQRTVTV